MARSSRSRVPVLAGTALSLIAHATVLLPLLVRALQPASPRPVVQARFDPEDFRAPGEPLEEPPPLGLEESTASTLTWIGYEQYEEHLARMAQIEQAAFTETPGEADEPAPPATPTEVSPPSAPPAEETAETSEAPQATEEPAEARDQPSEEEPVEPEEADGVEADGPEETPAAAPEAPDAVVAAEDAPSLPPTSLSRHLLSTLQPMLQQAAETQQTPPASEQQTPQTPQPPGAPPAAGSPGDPSDRESDPTSTVAVPLDQLKAGKPLATHGLEIRTRRPVFSTITLLTASPGNPLAELRFGADGRPLSAAILESSGDGRVDDTILSSLYRWRASGAPLKELQGQETVDVRILIVLNSRKVKKK